MESNGNEFINFRNGTFQWVDIQRFRGGAPGDVLAALIGHELFGCDYAGGDAGEDPRRHGPYWRERITPDSYDRVDAADAEQRLRVWAERNAPVTDAVRARLEKEVHDHLRTAEIVYELRDLGPEAFHDWGGVHHEFHEFVLVDSAGGVTLLVAADD